MRWFILGLVTLAAACGGQSNPGGPADAATDSGWTPPRDSGWTPPADSGTADSGMPPPSDAGSCDPGLSACGTACVDLQVDSRNCGVCGRTCSASQPCQAGKCTALPTDCRVTPCPSGHYCNLGDGVCKPGCAADSQCPQPGTCDLGSHACQCATGTHLCGSKCSPSSSPQSCGSSCTPCPTPTNATPTCDGTRCDFTCNTGYHRCGNACAADVSPQSCGTACTPCQPPSNASATCDGTTCGFSCNTGFHACGTGCASNASPLTCGASCSPCTVPTNGSATCSAGSCGVACNTGFHACGNVCTANTSPASCGAACTPCVPPANATATCNGTTCGFTCNTGFHLCGNQCLSNTSPASCGSLCTPCPAAPANGVSACLAGACGFTCNLGYTRCGAKCVNTNLDETACGACGVLCAAGQVCSEGSCRSPCAAGTSYSANLVDTVDAGTGARIVFARDVDGDQLDDAVVVNVGSGSSPYAAATVTIFRGDGGMGFALASDHALAPYQVCDSAAYGDVDGDGRWDLVVPTTYFPGAVGYPGGMTRTLRGAPDGGFMPVTSVGYGSLNVVMANFNGDAYQDVASAYRSELLVSLGSSTGLASQTIASLSPEVVYDLAAADFDGDGRADLVAVTHTGLYFVAGKGDGTFSAQVAIPNAVKPTGIRVGDMNEDGRPDLVVLEESYPFFARVKLNQVNAGGFAGFSAGTRYQLPGAPSEVAVTDINGDGHLDVADIFPTTSTVIGNFTASVAFLPGLGNGQLTTTGVAFAHGVQNVYGGFLVHDWTGDGVADVVVADGYSKLILLRGSCQ